MLDRHNPEAKELVASAQDMIPHLRERALECQTSGRIPESSMQEMLERRLFDITKPKRYGGLELGWDVFAEVAIRISAGCGSSGWVYSVLAQHPLFANRIGIDFMDEAWGENPDALFAATKFQNGTGAFKKVDGGYLGYGISTFGSGSLHSDWVLEGGAPVEGSDEKVICMVPVRDLEIRDTWNPDGLEGTGSHHVKLDGCFIPAHRARSPGKPPSGGIVDAPLYRTTGLGVPFGLSVVLIGIAMNALEIFAEDMKHRKSRDGTRIADLQSLQMRVGESAAEIDAATNSVRMHLKALMETLKSLPPPTGAGGYEHGKWPDYIGMGIENGKWPAPGTGDDSPHLGLANSFAAQLAYSAIQRLAYAAGASQLDRDNALHRCFRDATAGVRQYGINWDVARTRAGQSFLGVN